MINTWRRERAIAAIVHLLPALPGWLAMVCDDRAGPQQRPAFAAGVVGSARARHNCASPTA